MAKLILNYIFVLFALGVWLFLCFKFLFPMIGQWLKGLVKRLEDANKRMEREREKILNQTTKRTYDDQKVIDGLYMTQDEIKFLYEKEGFSKSIKAEQEKED